MRSPGTSSDTCRSDGERQQRRIGLRAYSPNGLLQGHLHCPRGQILRHSLYLPVPVSRRLLFRRPYIDVVVFNFLQK